MTITARSPPGFPTLHRIERACQIPPLEGDGARCLDSFISANHAGFLRARRRTIFGVAHRPAAVFCTPVTTPFRTVRLTER